VTGRPV